MSLDGLGTIWTNAPYEVRVSMARSFVLSRHISVNDLPEKLRYDAFPHLRPKDNAVKAILPTPRIKPTLRMRIRNAIDGFFK